MKGSFGWLDKHKALLMIPILLLVLGFPIGFGTGAASGAGMRDTLFVAIPSGVESIDPHLSGGLSERVWCNVYESLLSRDASGQFEPRLATSWKQLDATHWQFNIRPGVKFTTGNQADAEAIAYSITMKNNPKDPHQALETTDWIKNAWAKDPNTLMIETTGPYPLALYYLGATESGWIADYKARQQWGDLKLKSAGTGPFMLDSIAPGEYVQLKRNPGYWGPKPKIEILRFRIIPEEATRVLALKKGELDITLDLGPGSYQQLRGDPNIHVDTIRAFYTSNLQYNMGETVMKDVKLRQAIRLAIDKKTMVHNVIGVRGDPADSVVLDKSYGYVSIPEFFEYNPAKAQQILDEDGWKPGPDGIRQKGGQRLHLVLIVDYTRDYHNREMAEAVQAYLKQVGIDVELKLFERGPMIETMVQKGTGYQLAITRWSGSTNEASWWIGSQFLSSNQGPGGWGTTRNRDPQMDAMIAAAVTTTDQAKSLSLWRQLQRKIYDESLMNPLYFGRSVEAVRKNVSGFVSTPDEWYQYKYLSVSVTQ